MSIAVLKFSEMCVKEDDKKSYFLYPTVPYVPLYVEVVKSTVLEFTLNFVMHVTFGSPYFKVYQLYNCNYRRSGYSRR